MCLYSSLTQVFSYMFAKFVCVGTTVWPMLLSNTFQTFFLCLKSSLTHVLFLYVANFCVCRYSSVTLVPNSIKNSQQVSLPYSHGMTPFVICVFDRWPGTSIRISSAAFISNFNNSLRLAVRSKPFIIQRSVLWSGTTFFTSAPRNFSPQN